MSEEEIVDFAEKLSKLNEDQLAVVVGSAISVVMLKFGSANGAKVIHELVRAFQAEMRAGA